jgi:hypothetical protein
MRISNRGRKLRGAACAAFLMGLLAGCNSSKDNPASDGGLGTSPPEEIQGIATPSNVAVVTATNAD